MFDYLVSLYLEELRRNEFLDAQTQDMHEKVKAMTKVKAYYIDKVQNFEARASTLELSIFEKDKEIH